MKTKRSKGFTLVELMIVIAIIGILASVFVPFWQKHKALRDLPGKIMAGDVLTEREQNAYDVFRKDVDEAVMEPQQKEEKR